MGSQPTEIFATLKNPVLEQNQGLSNPFWNKTHVYPGG